MPTTESEHPVIDEQFLENRTEHENMPNILYSGQMRERVVWGETIFASPVVEIDPVNSHAWYKLRTDKPGDQSDISGRRADIREDDFTGFDPIIVFRALTLLDQFDVITDPYRDLRATSILAAGTVTRKQYDNFLTRVSGFLDRQTITHIRHAIPQNLDEVIDQLQSYNIPIDGSTIAKEIRRNKMVSTPLFEDIIEETQARLRDEEDIYLQSRINILNL